MSAGAQNVVGSSFPIKITVSSVSATIPAQTCSGLTVRTENEINEERPVSEATTVLLRTSGEGNFFSAADCSTPTRTNSVTLNPGESSTPVYYFTPRGETNPVIEASAPSTSLVSAALPVVAQPAPVVSVTIWGPRAARINTCSGPYTARLTNGVLLPEFSLTALTANFGLSPQLTAYSDHLCSNSVTQTTVSAGNTQTDAFYLRSSIAQLGNVTVTIPDLSINTTAEVSFSSSFTGIVTFAGKSNPMGTADGVGSAARFSTPSRMTSDGTHVYVIDGPYARIRRFTPTTGEVRTVVGNPADTQSAMYRDGYGPLLNTTSIYDLTADSQNLYFSQTGCIRKMNLSTLMVETIVGDCSGWSTTGQNGIGLSARLPIISHLRIDPVLRRLYAGGQSSIWKIDLNTLNTELIAGHPSLTGDTDGTGTSARFDLNQGGLLVLNDGKVLVGQLSKLKIMDQSTYSITTVLSSSGHQENMVIVGSDIYAFNSMQTEYLRRFTLSPYTSEYVIMTMRYASIDGPDGVGSINGARGLTAVGTDLYFSEQGSHLLRKVDTLTRETSTVAGSNGNHYGGTDVASFQSRATNIIASSGSLIYVGDRTNCNIRNINTATGAVTLIAGSESVSFTPDRCNPTDGNGGAAGTARFSQSIGTGAISGTYLYVADGTRIRRVDLASAGLDVVTLAGSSNNYPIADGVGPAAILQNANFPVIMGSSLYFADNYGIRKLDLNTNEVTTVVGNPNQEGFTQGLLADSRFRWITGMSQRGTSNALIVTDRFSVRSVDFDTGTVTLLSGSSYPTTMHDGGPTPGPATFMDIRGMAFKIDPLTSNEIVYLYDKYAIREYNITTGTIRSLSGNTNPTPDMSDSDGLLHQAGHNPVSDYYVGLAILPDGLYFPSKQGIRKLY